MTNFNKYLSFSKEVQEAIKNNKPIVALESTIITHGMPYPDNVTMASEVSEIVRQNGACPATIAILDGKIKIGLEDSEIEMFAKAKDVIKVSRCDLAYALSAKKMGGTTVAATMICANLAGIKFFVTGGIGGVHRGFEDTMDVSADLEELSLTDVTVICAGAKSILDLPRTLEYLETKGVPVIGYQTSELPAFFTRESGYHLTLRMDSPEEIANFVHTKDELSLKGGVLITNPIPEEHALSKEYIDSIIEDAIAESLEKGIHGKETTPFLLANILERTGGDSLKSNIQLVFNNARLGSKIAVAYHSSKR